jgi:hypothetical protein
MNAKASRTTASSAAHLEFALRSGAILFIGPRHAEEMTDRKEIERILRSEYPSADIDTLMVPFAYCWHFLLCVGRNHQYNYDYPVFRLHSIIAECFGLKIDDLPVQALLAAIHARLCQTKLILNSDPKDRLATITSKACPGDTRKPSVYICELGRRGVLPPIEIMYP